MNEGPGILILGTPRTPGVNTAYPNLRNNMAPEIVEIAVNNTGPVPDLLFTFFTTFG